MMETRRRLFGRGNEGGFTLVELLIVILIVGILSAVALPLYLGYTKDARLAEGKALGGSTLTALSGCVQVKGSGGSCVQSEIRNRVGLDATNSTYDGRWLVNVAQLRIRLWAIRTYFWSSSGDRPFLSGATLAEAAWVRQPE